MFDVVGWMRVDHWRWGASELGVDPFSIWRLSRSRFGSCSFPRVPLCSTFGTQNLRFQRQMPSALAMNECNPRTLKSLRYPTCSLTGTPEGAGCVFELRRKMLAINTSIA